MSIAHNRLGLGDAVTVVDAGLGGAASAASAGMLSIHHMDPWIDEELLGFMRHSRSRWRRLAEELPGIDCRHDGILSLAADEDEMAALRHSFQGERRYLDADEVAALEPNLAEVIAATITKEATIDAPLALEALRRRIAERGGELAGDSIGSLEMVGGRIAAAVGASRRYAADEFVFATGAWLPPDLPRLPIRPVKGQLLGFFPPSPSEPMPLGHSVWARGYYLVVRRDRLLFGATVEEQGFDYSNTAERVAEMLNLALETLPSLRHWRLRCWGGLRPTSLDGLPIIGRFAAANAVIASGHCRNGILLAPATAEAVSSILDGGDEIKAFSPSRFLSGKKADVANTGERRAASVA